MNAEFEQENTESVSGIGRELIAGDDLSARLNGVTPLSPLAGAPQGGTIVQLASQGGFTIGNADMGQEPPKPSPVQQFLPNLSQG